MWGLRKSVRVQGSNDICSYPNVQFAVNQPVLETLRTRRFAVFEPFLAESLVS